MSHTPTPWDAIIDNKIVYVQSPLYDICDLYHRNNKGEIYTKDNAEANAALIVKAVNNHDKLVKALEKIRYLPETSEHSAEFNMWDMAEIAEKVLKELKE